MKMWPTIVLPGEKGCIMCGRMSDVNDMQKLSNNQFMCKECTELYKDAATIVCATCGAHVAKVVPGVIDCGYDIKPKEVLHVDKCINCCEDVTVSEILEITEWQKHNKPKLYIYNESKHENEKGSEGDDDPGGSSKETT